MPSYSESLVESFMFNKTFVIVIVIVIVIVMRHGRIGFGLMDKSQHSRPDNIIDDVLFINI